MSETNQVRRLVMPDFTELNTDKRFLFGDDIEVSGVVVEDNADAPEINLANKDAMKLAFGHTFRGRT